VASRRGIGCRQCAFAVAAPTVQAEIAPPVEFH